MTVPAAARRRARASSCAASPSASGRPPPSPTSRWTSVPARSTPSSARTAPARARSSRSSAGVHPPGRRRRSSSTASPIHIARPGRTPARSASPSSTRSRGCSRTCPSPRTSSSAQPADAAARLHRLGRDAPGGERAVRGARRPASTCGAPVRGLSMADQQLIEIAKALSVDARVLILDEPTASLSAHEVERLFTIVRRTRDRGVAVLFVSHRLDEVFALCDRATVLPRRPPRRHRRTTASLTTADLVRHMVGRAVTLFPKGEAPIGDVLLEVRGLARRGRLPRRQLQRPGGRDPRLRRPRRRRADRDRPGALRHRPRRRPARSASRAGRSTSQRPSAALGAGIAYVPEDRHQDGLVLDFSIAENVTLPILTAPLPAPLRAAGRPSGRSRAATRSGCASA